MTRAIVTRRPRAQLISHHDEPDRLREQNKRHAMNVEPQVAHADRNHDERRNEPAIGGDTSAESSVAQGGGGPENNCERSSDRINSTEGLIDLKNTVNHDLPLTRIGR